MASAPAFPNARQSEADMTAPGFDHVETWIFDLDNTLTDFMKYKEKSIAAAVDAGARLIRARPAGQPVSRSDSRRCKLMLSGSMG